MNNYEQLLLSLGMAMGALMDESNRQALAEAVRSGQLNPAYLAMLRDMLASVLRRAELGRGVFSDVPGLTDEQIVAIRDTLLPSQGDSFDAVAFARAVLVAARSSQ